MKVLLPEYGVFQGAPIASHMVGKAFLIAFHLLSVTIDYYDADDGDDALCLHRRYLRHHCHCRHSVI